MSKAEELASYFDNFTKSSHTLQDGTPLHIAAKDHLRALDASHQRLKEALTQMLKHFPTDDDMVSAGWAPSEVEEACTAYDMGRAALEQAKDLS